MENLFSNEKRSCLKLRKDRGEKDIVPSERSLSEKNIHSLSLIIRSSLKKKKAEL